MNQQQKTNFLSKLTKSSCPICIRYLALSMHQPLKDGTKEQQEQVNLKQKVEAETFLSQNREHIEFHFKDFMLPNKDKIYLHEGDKLTNVKEQKNFPEPTKTPDGPNIK
jgi:hypothetical protein